MGLIEDIAIKVLGAKDAVGAFQDLDKGMKRLGMTLRLSGRDWMRMGGSFQRTGMGMIGMLGKLSKGTSFLSDWFEEMSWCMEDIADIIGDQLSPFFEFLINILETVTDILEANPWLTWTLVIAAFIGLILILIGKLMSFKGTLDLLTGTFMTAGEQGLSFWNTLKLLMFGTHSSSQETRAYAAQLAGLGPVLDTVSGKIQTVNMHLRSYRDSIKLVGKTSQRQWDWANRAVTGQKKLSKATGKGAKKQRSFAKSTKGMMLPLVGLITGFFMLMGAMEHLSPIFEALGDVVDILFDFFDPLIEMIANIIEENPALIAGMILAIIGAIIAMKATDFVGWLKGLFTGVGKAADSLPGLNKGTTSLAKNMIALAAAIGILMIAMAGAIWILDQTSFTLPEIIALMFSLVGAVTLMTAAFVGMAVVMGITGASLAPLIPILLPLAVVLLSIGAAAFLVGAGFMLAGLGVKFAAEGIALLVGYVPQVFALGPALFGLAAGFIALGGAGLLAMPGIFALGGAILFLSASLLALIGVLTMLHGMGMGGVANAIGGGIATGIPLMQEGGMIKEGGLAYLHPAEVVTPAGETRKSQTVTNYNTFHISGTVRGEEDFERIAKEVSKIQEREYKGSSY